MTPRFFLLFSVLFATLNVQAQILVSSNLPIIVINTINNQPVLDDPKIMADMGIIYNGPNNRNYLTDPFNDYNGKIGIEMRGSSSQYMFPKKSYGFECWDTLGNEIDMPILGMPAESDWCLIANYADKSLSNNAIAYSTWAEMGWWGTRCMSVELLLNGVYQGVYLVVEKVKRDSSRINIAKLQPADTTGDELTGGYILKKDQPTGSQDWGWYSNYECYGIYAAGMYPYYNCIYPDSNSLQPQQAAYISAYVDSFESALHNHNFDPVTGWQHYGDINSFVDFFILQELAKNVDGYRISMYFYKDKDSRGGKLTMGVVWDFDLAWDNCFVNDAHIDTGFYWRNGDYFWSNNASPSWWNHLWQDSLFTSALRCRWDELKTTTLSISSLQADADSMYNHLNESQQRNFNTWPILGQAVCLEPTPIPTTYLGEINELKDWINDRWIWLDANIPGSCSQTGISENPASDNIKTWPNPFTDDLYVQVNTEINTLVTITITDLTGRVVQTETVVPAGDTKIVRVNLGDLAAGMYQLTFESNGVKSSTSIIRN
ncbi:MAG: CotH kinase family protein [Bacteroidia bacterium]